MSLQVYQMNFHSTTHLTIPKENEKAASLQCIENHCLKHSQRAQLKDRIFTFQKYFTEQ